MKNLIAILFCLFIGMNSYAQTKQEVESLKYVKNFHENLKKVKIDVSDPLWWKYTYGDTSATTLTKLSKVLEVEGLKTMKLVKSTREKNMYELTMYEQKVYKSPKSLNERVMYLNSVAHILKIINEEATISAEKPQKLEYIKDYKPVGKDGKKNEEENK